MNMIRNSFIILSSLIILSTANVSAFVFDVWEIEGSNPLEVAEATTKFKALAMAGGAQYLDIRSSVKIRGDRSQDTSFVIGYYENMQAMLETNALVQQNPDWLQSTFGDNDGVVTTSGTFGNDAEFTGEIEVGNAVAYSFAEVNDGINFFFNFPKVAKMMAEAGAPAAIGVASCAVCGSETLPANTVMWMSAANSSDLGKAMDIFSSNKMQRWIYSNLAPHLNITDGGIHIVTSN